MDSSELVNKVNRDPALSGDEKETAITMYGQDKEFSIYTAKPTVMKSLLKHDHFELDWARVISEELEDKERDRVEDRASLRETAGDIVALKGKMPVGLLTVKSKPRANNHQSSVVNSETIDPSVFED